MDLEALNRALLHSRDLGGWPPSLSFNCAPGLNLTDTCLLYPLPHRFVHAVTIAELNNIGWNITPTPSRTNHAHCSVWLDYGEDPPDSDAVEALATALGDPIMNPVRRTSQ
jgi:hypothetical protein